MGGRSQIDAELRGIARVLPRGWAGPRMLRLVRRLERSDRRSQPPEGGELVELGEITIRVHRPQQPAAGRLPAVLWIHGGGFIGGSAFQEDKHCRQVADELGVLAAAVDYRRAPEHCFPTALEDCYAALTWLAQHEEVDPDRIAVAGASAGGGLAASLALLARDRREVDLALQALAYPMLDDRTALRTDIDESSFRLWSGKSNAFGWTSYLGCSAGSEDVSALAAPARAENLRGVAPTWLGLCTCDVLYEEGLAYAARLEEAGVPCTVHVAHGAFHGFDAIRPQATVSKEFHQAQLDALSSALTPR